MKHVPFVAFPPHEQNAVLRVLRGAGIPPEGVCVSRLEPAERPAPRGTGALTIVTTPRWSRTYGSTPEADWLVAFERELPRA
jgi:hypothetical protein